MNIIYLVLGASILVSAGGITSKDLDEKSFEVPLKNMTGAVELNPDRPDSELMLYTFPKLDTCIAAVYAECGVALRGRNRKEVNWPTVPDGFIEATDEYFQVRFTSPTISAAKKTCVKNTVVTCN